MHECALWKEDACTESKIVIVKNLVCFNFIEVWALWSFFTTKFSRTMVSTILGKYHIFSLCDDKREETDLVEFKIGTGDVSPKKETARRFPFAARQEIARQHSEE